MMTMLTKRSVIGLFPSMALAARFQPSLLALIAIPSSALGQAAPKGPSVRLLSQDGRPPASVPLQSADSNLPNVNWVRGNEARTEWTWAAQLIDNPTAFPSNLGRYL